MSSPTNTYVIYGIIFPYEIIGDEDAKWEPYQDSAYDTTTNPKGNITALVDGMNGEYVILGHVVAKSSEYDGLVAPESLYNYDFDLFKFADYILTALNDLGIDSAIYGYKIGWHILTHYR